MEDLLGNTLSLGDTVATNSAGYSDLQVGKIIKFTPTACRVEYPSKLSNSQKLCQSCQIVLIEEEMAIVYWLKHAKP